MAKILEGLVQKPMSAYQTKLTRDNEVWLKRIFLVGCDIRVLQAYVESDGKGTLTQMTWQKGQGPSSCKISNEGMKEGVGQQTSGQAWQLSRWPAFCIAAARMTLQLAWYIVAAGWFIL